MAVVGSGMLVGFGLNFVLAVYGASAWKLSRTYDIALGEPVRNLQLDAAQGERMGSFGAPGRPGTTPVGKPAA